MANFNEKNGQIELSPEDKSIFKEAGAGLGQKHISLCKNLKKAIEDNFIGWEVKEKEGLTVIQELQERIKMLEARMDDLCSSPYPDAFISQKEEEIK